MKVFDRIAHWTQVRIRWATIVVKRIVRFITHDMWYLNMEDLSRWKKRGVESSRLAASRGVSPFSAVLGQA